MNAEAIFFTLTFIAVMAQLCFPVNKKIEVKKG